MEISCLGKKLKAIGYSRNIKCINHNFYRVGDYICDKCNNIIGKELILIGNVALILRYDDKLHIYRVDNDIEDVIKFNRCGYSNECCIDIKYCYSVNINEEWADVVISLIDTYESIVNKYHLLEIPDFKYGISNTTKFDVIKNDRYYFISSEISNCLFMNIGIGVDMTDKTIGIVERTKKNNRIFYYPQIVVDMYNIGELDNRARVVNLDGTVEVI